MSTVDYTHRVSLARQPLCPLQATLHHLQRYRTQKQTKVAGQTKVHVVRTRSLDRGTPTHDAGSRLLCVKLDRTRRAELISLIN